MPIQRVSNSSLSPASIARFASSRAITDFRGGNVEFAHRAFDAHATQHAKATLDLAVHLQHRRTATYRDAALCVEATISVVNLIAIIAGLRDLKSTLAN